jgi:hypothetical protein
MNSSNNVSITIGISAVLILAAVSTSPAVYAWDTHMTLHNLVDYPAGLSIVGADSCTAQVNSTCEAGADYVWYTVKVCVGTFACNAQPLYQTTLNGVYGHCNVYVQFTPPPSSYDVTHHCTAAEKAGLKPPATITTTTPAPTSVPQEQNRTK